MCTDYRVLKLFNREGVLQHTSEYVAGLEKYIAWQPSGPLIAASQTIHNKHKIIFFEKNGLQHGEFDLSYEANTFHIAGLFWSVNSDVLLINGHSMDGAHQHILLYTRSNYYWYLKQTLLFDEPAKHVTHIEWDELSYYKLHIWRANGTYSQLTMHRPVHHTRDGQVIVIDGNKLNISHFGLTLIPPPMRNYAIEFKKSINMQATQIASNSKGYIAVTFNNDDVALFKLDQCQANELDNSLHSIFYSLDNVPKDMVLFYMLIKLINIERIAELTLPVLTDNNRLLGVIDNKIVALDFELDSPGVIESICTLEAMKPLTLNVLSENELFLSDSSGLLWRVDINSRLIQEYLNCNAQLRYNVACSKILVHQDAENRTHVIALTENNLLYYDETLITLSNVNSVELYDSRYLVFATVDSMFYCWPLKNFDLNKSNKIYAPRNLEKGSEIVCTSSGQAKVVLQLPRGNLEAFHPRLPVLDQVGYYIDNLNYIEAFRMLRRNRLNLNFICDHNMSSFIENCDLFIQQIGQESVDWLCLFLTELCPDNLCSMLTNQPAPKVVDKVNNVCTLLHDRMDQLDKLRYLNPILLTFIKKDVPEVANALREVKNLPNNELRDKAIKFLLYVVSVNQLLDDALGTYDFDTFLMVASKSDKDPKEYIAMVNEFKKIEDENYRKYRIDTHLARHSSALAHLSRCPDQYDQVCSLVEQHHLFKKAISLYQLNAPSNEGKFTEIWDLYGEYLFKKKYYNESAIAFRRALNFGQAFKMYLMASDWNMAIVCARRLSDGDEDKFVGLVNSVAQQLVLNGDPLSGALLIEQYTGNYQQAFSVLVKGHQWNTALRYFYDFKFEQSSLEDLKLEVVNSFNSYDTTIQANIEQLQEHCARLEQLKENKQNLMEGHNNDDMDSYSDTSSLFDSSSICSEESNLSSQTLKTNRSASRARQMKKRQSRKYVLKKGSANEDIQIVHAVKELMTSSVRFFSDCSSLIKILYELYYAEESFTLQNKLDQLSAELIKANTFIWSSEYFLTRLAEGNALTPFPIMISLLLLLLLFGKQMNCYVSRRAWTVWANGGWCSTEHDDPSPPSAYSIISTTRTLFFVVAKNGNSSRSTNNECSSASINRIHVYSPVKQTSLKTGTSRKHCACVLYEFVKRLY